MNRHYINASHVAYCSRHQPAHVPDDLEQDYQLLRLQVLGLLTIIGILCLGIVAIGMVIGWRLA
ncbi:MAG: hypothetical protein WCL44_08985 [bacterium]